MGSHRLLTPFPEREKVPAIGDLFSFLSDAKPWYLRAIRDSSAIPLYESEAFLGGNGLVTVLARPCNPGFLWHSADFRPKGLSLGSS